MTKDEVLKQRGAVMDAAVRQERARLAIEKLNEQLEVARKEYADAGNELYALRRVADATEASAVQAIAAGKTSEALDEQASDKSGLRG